MMMRKVVSCCSVLLVIASISWVFSQEPGKASRAAFMRLKLEPSKHLLEGIALGDFEMISKDAGQISKLLLDESWMVKQTEEYRQLTNDFRKAVFQINRSAKEKNLDGVTLAYVQMTMQCVHCHQTLRDGR